eukprot:4686606-Pyramimonas_sp.AAC.1
MSLSIGMLLLSLQAPMISQCPLSACRSCGGSFAGVRNPGPGTPACNVKPNSCFGSNIFCADAGASP